MKIVGVSTYQARYMLPDNCSDERGRTLNISFLALHTMLLHKLGQSVR